MLVAGQMTATARATLVLDAKALAESWETSAAAASAAAMPSMNLRRPRSIPLVCRLAARLFPDIILPLQLAQKGTQRARSAHSWHGPEQTLADGPS
jgi:hypothetical protein